MTTLQKTSALVLLYNNTHADVLSFDGRPIYAPYDPLRCLRLPEHANHEGVLLEMQKMVPHKEFTIPDRWPTTKEPYVNTSLYSEWDGVTLWNCFDVNRTFSFTTYGNTLFCTEEDAQRCKELYNLHEVLSPELENAWRLLACNRATVEYDGTYLDTGNINELVAGLREKVLAEIPLLMYKLPVRITSKLLRNELWYADDTAIAMSTDFHHYRRIDILSEATAYTCVLDGDIMYSMFEADFEEILDDIMKRGKQDVNKKHQEHLYTVMELTRDTADVTNISFKIAGSKVADKVQEYIDIALDLVKCSNAHVPYKNSIYAYEGLLHLSDTDRESILGNVIKRVWKVPDKYLRKFDKDVVYCVTESDLVSVHHSDGRCYVDIMINSKVYPCILHNGRLFSLYNIDVPCLTTMLGYAKVSHDRRYKEIVEHVKKLDTPWEVRV